MKQFISILLCIVMISQATYQGISYAYYTIEKDYIVENYCINKANPALKCDGKCHLKDMLEQQDNIQQDKSTELPPAPSLAEIKLMVLFLELSTLFRFLSTQQDLLYSITTANFSYSFTYEYLYHIASLDPPKLS